MLSLNLVLCILIVIWYCYIRSLFHLVFWYCYIWYHYICYYEGITFPRVGRWLITVTTPPLPLYRRPWDHPCLPTPSNTNFPISLRLLHLFIFPLILKSYAPRKPNLLCQHFYSYYNFLNPFLHIFSFLFSYF